MIEVTAFDEERVNEYLESIWDSKYATGLYFSALQEKGIEIPIEIDVGLKGEKVKRYRTLHALHDGYSALKALGRELKLDFKFNEPEVRRPKSWLQAIKSAVSSNPTVIHEIPKQRPYSNTTTGTNYILPFQRDISTVECLNKVAKILMESLTCNQTSRWMIPCRISNEDKLSATYFGIEASMEDSVSTLKEKFKAKLIAGEQWGFYFLAKVGLIFGRYGVRLGTKKTIAQDKTLWLGSVSNMGDLDYSNMVETLNIYHPVRWHRPIGVAMYKFNGVQFLSVCFHESLHDYDLEEVRAKIIAAFA